MIIKFFFLISPTSMCSDNAIFKSPFCINNLHKQFYVNNLEFLKINLIAWFKHKIGGSNTINIIIYVR